jgi:ubiquinone/menaquinone biosynthesis C-methylase UbiE
MQRGLSYPDASFDVVMSLIGSMFAPRPELVASEMVRVCRPGVTLMSQCVEVHIYDRLSCRLHLEL